MTKINWWSVSSVKPPIIGDRSDRVLVWDGFEINICEYWGDREWIADTGRGINAIYWSDLPDFSPNKLTPRIDIIGQNGGDGEHYSDEDVA